MQKRLLSRYESSIDDKGRVVLPAQLKKAMDENLETVIIEKDIHTISLNIYTEADWNKKIDTIMSHMNGGQGYDPLSEFDVELMNQIFEESARLTVAANGRINIPTDHLDYAGITKQVVLIGSGDHVRLLDEKTYKGEKAARLPIKEKIMANRQQNNRT